MIRIGLWTPKLQKPTFFQKPGTISIPSYSLGLHVFVSFIKGIFNSYPLMYHFQSPKLGVAHREALQKVRDANNFNAAMFHGCFVLHIYILHIKSQIGSSYPGMLCFFLVKNGTNFTHFEKIQVYGKNDRKFPKKTIGFPNFLLKLQSKTRGPIWVHTVYFCT